MYNSKKKQQQGRQELYLRKGKRVHIIDVAGRSGLHVIDLLRNWEQESISPALSVPKPGHFRRLILVRLRLSNPVRSTPELGQGPGVYGVFRCCLMCRLHIHSLSPSVSRISF